MAHLVDASTALVTMTETARDRLVAGSMTVISHLAADPQQATDGRHHHEPQRVAEDLFERFGHL